jgi:hypothetical protein
VGKTLHSDKDTQLSLTDYFTNIHPRVMQMAVGLKNGATIMQHLLCTLLGAHPEYNNASCEARNRVAVVTVDVKNAFNEVSRAALFDTVCGRRGKYGTTLFQPYWPFLRTFYGTTGCLTYTSQDGSVLNINSEEGTHQGDVWSPALFAAAIHPSVCTALDHHPGVVAVMWADNIFLVGPLLQAAAAARQVRDELRPLGLDLNNNETIAYVPNAPDTSSLRAVLSEELPDFPVQPVLDGINILGVPFGSPQFVSTGLRKIVEEIEGDLPRIAPLRDGLMHFQMMRFCESTRFAHVTRALPPQYVQKIAKQLDSIIMGALEQYWGWPEMPTEDHAPRYQAARRIVRGPLREGGFGLTAVSSVCLPAFYRSAALSLRWICNRKSLVDILQWDLSLHPRQVTNTFVGEFLDAEEQLLLSACKRPDDFSLKPPGSVALLPDWDHLIGPRHDGTFYPIPPQRVIVRTYLASQPTDFSLPQDLQPPSTGTRNLQVVRDHSSSVLKDKLGLSRQQLKTTAIVYNPMAFLMAIPVTKWQLFPRHLFQRWVRLVLDLPFDTFASKCQWCGQPQDDSGHHHATCSKAASREWKRGHDHVIEAVADILHTSGIAYTAKESQIPAHVDSRKKGDILVECQIGRFQDLILDFSLTHPRYGASKLHPPGQWKPDGLAHLTKSKDNKHAISYEQGQHAYLSLTADTYGKISEDFVRFIWMVATSASTNFRPSELPSTDGPDAQLDEFAVQRGFFFSRMRVQVAAAIAKAAAARFVQDDVDDGLPLHTMYERKVADRALEMPDLPLYHVPS